MPEHDKDKEHRDREEESSPQGKIASTLREGRRFGDWITHLTTAQFQALALMFMTIFVCLLTGWLVYRWDDSNREDKIRQDKQLESIMRENNSQAELVRQHCSHEIEKSRQVNSQNMKGIQDTLLNFISMERIKDRDHELIRDREYLKVTKEIRDAWAAFAIKLAEIERHLRKMPVDCENLSVMWKILFPHELQIAPMPHVKEWYLWSIP